MHGSYEARCLAHASTCRRHPRREYRARPGMLIQRKRLLSPGARPECKAIIRKRVPPQILLQLTACLLTASCRTTHACQLELQTSAGTSVCTALRHSRRSERRWAARTGYGSSIDARSLYFLTTSLRACNQNTAGGSYGAAAGGSLPSMLFTIVNLLADGQ